MRSRLAKRLDTHTSHTLSICWEDIRTIIRQSQRQDYLQKPRAKNQVTMTELKSAKTKFFRVECLKEFRILIATCFGLINIFHRLWICVSLSITLRMNLDSSQAEQHQRR